MYILVLNFFLWFSNMYGQCSHCFKMYHVNINTSYQIAGFGMFVWRQGGARASADVGALAHRMGRGFLSRRMCGHRSVFEALPASGYVIFPRGDCSSLGSDASSEKNAVSPPREHPPLPRPGFPHACSTEGAAVLPPGYFPLIPAEP